MATPGPAVGGGGSAASPSWMAGRLVRGLLGRVGLGTAATVGVLVGTGSAARAGLLHQARLAAERIGLAALPPPLQDGRYLPDGTHLALGRRRRATASGHPPARTASGRAAVRALPTSSPLRLAMLGDSTSAGFGAADADSLPGVMLARAVAAELDRPVLLGTYAVVGTGAADLARQWALAALTSPDVVVIVVGANDVRDRISPAASVDALVAVVRAIRAGGVAVVVATCPDLGVVTPIPAPLRQLAGHWSRTLAARQERAVVAAGGVAVPIGRLVSPGFAGHPELFAPDLFHPSGAGYARAVAVLLPAVFTALGIPRRVPPPTSGFESMPADAQHAG